MDENQNDVNEQKVLDFLKTRNEEASKLLQDITSKKDEYNTLLTELQDKKNSIENAINEIASAKQVFIDDINQKLEEYHNTFLSKNKDLEDLTSNLNSKATTLTANFDELTTKYTTNADEKINELDDKINTVTETLNKEQEDFDNFLKENKTDFSQKATEFSNLITEYNTKASESAAKVKTNLEEATSNSAKITQIHADAKVFKESVDDYIEKMKLATTNIDTKMKEFEQVTQHIIDTNNNLTQEIKEQLELATGESLFHTFNQRKKDLQVSQTFWLIGLMFSVVIFILFSIWIIHELSSLDLKNVNWFFDVILKFSASAPIVYLVAFLTDRYTKERRLLEEYAFKSTISLALKPYFDLVSELDVNTQEKEFLIKSIESIFATPTDKVFRTKECQNKINIAHLADLAKELEAKVKGDN